MIGGVAWRRDGDHVTRGGQTPAGAERAEWFGGQIECDRFEPGWPALGQVSAKASSPSACELKFPPSDTNVALRKVRESTIVVDMRCVRTTCLTSRVPIPKVRN